MPRISLSQAIGPSFINSLLGSGTTATNPLSSAISDSQSSVSSISSGLRLGARIYGQAVTGINSVIAALGVSKESLEDLGKITDKMIGLANRATQSSIGSDSRANLDQQFQKLADEFFDIIDKAAVGERNVLSRDDLSEIFRAIGLDETSADSISQVFQKFATFDSDDEKYLASEYAEGGKPYVPPTNAYATQVTIGDGTFSNGTAHSTTLAPTGVAIGDANEDGVMDLFTTQYNAGGSFGIGLGNGDGTFNAPTLYTTPGDYSNGIRAVDVNGDLHLDAVVNEQWMQGFSVALGNGDGTFNNAVFYANPGANDSYGVDTADFDNDGDLDVVNTGAGSGALNVFLNDGSGNYGAASTYQVGGLSASAPTAADFNNDGRADLAVGLEGTSSVSILIGNGDGTFRTADLFTAGTDPRDLVAGDVNNDGQIDLVSANFASADFSVLLGNGDGTFAAPLNHGVASFSQGLGMGDLNGDDYQDLVVMTDNDQIEVRLGNGDGTFSLGAYHGVDTAPDGEIAVGDFTGDNVADFAVPHIIGTTVRPFVGNATTGTRNANVRSSDSFTTIFETGRTLRNRPDAFGLLHDLKGLREQIDKNIKGIDNALSVVGQNLDLVRATGLAMLSLADQLNGDEEAAEVATMLRRKITNDASGALAQAENLQPLAVAALTLSSTS